MSGQSPTWPAKGAKPPSKVISQDLIVAPDQAFCRGVPFDPPGPVGLRKETA